MQTPLDFMDDDIEWAQHHLPASLLLPTMVMVLTMHIRHENANMYRLH